MKRNTNLIAKSSMLLLLCLGTFSVTSAAHADEDTLTKFARVLTELRTEVEELSSEVEAAKENQRAQLRSLSAQKTDLELQIQREERRAEQLKAQQKREIEDVSKASEASEELKPVVKNSVEKLRAQINNGLPFKRVERLAALQKIESQFNQGLLPPEKAVARLWAFVEDEMRLTRENGLYRQSIEVDGQEELAEIARVGMVSMYFRTNDGRVGTSTKNGDEWSYSVIRDEEGQAQIDALFDAFKKQIRVGYFQLPNALP